MNSRSAGKRRTREHVIADLSVNHIERYALLCGYVAERIVHDYGYDLFIFSFDQDGYAEPGEIRVQAKASDSPRIVDDSSIAVRIQRANLVQWMRERVPVVLVSYDVAGDNAYWIHVQDYFGATTGFNMFVDSATITVRVPLANKFNPAAVRALVALKNAGFGGRAFDENI